MLSSGVGKPMTWPRTTCTRKGSADTRGNFIERSQVLSLVFPPSVEKTSTSPFESDKTTFAYEDCGSGATSKTGECHPVQGGAATSICERDTKPKEWELQ